MTYNNRALGTHMEEEAARYLEELGFRILIRNYRCKIGEIDLIAQEGRYLVFVEVKYRNYRTSGWAEEAVNRKKQRRISLCAVRYLQEQHLPMTTPCRFDVIAMNGRRIKLYRNAYPACGY